VSSELIKCGCDSYLGHKGASSYQEKTYGNGLRVHNSVSGEGKFRCTICGTERGKSGGSEDPKSKKK
jgi:hypothetical protein